MENNDLTKYEIRKQKKLKERRQFNKKHFWRHLPRFLLPALFIIGALLLAIWFIFKTPRVSEKEIIAQRGIHWHPQISINIKGENKKIPANIGLAGAHSPIHTHDESGTIHLEYPGIVTNDNVRIGQFFKLWGKTFNKECIFEFCNGPEGTVKMLVNGEVNNEFDNYIMQHQDRIEIIFN